MERKPVSSKNVKSVGHDPETNTLEVEFSHGGVYRYSGVDKDKYDALMNASSIGSHIHSHIKGIHPHTKADST